MNKRRFIATIDYLLVSSQGGESSSDKQRERRRSSRERLQRQNSARAASSSSAAASSRAGRHLEEVARHTVCIPFCLCTIHGPGCNFLKLAWDQRLFILSPLGSRVGCEHNLRNLSSSLHNMSVHEAHLLPIVMFCCQASVAHELPTDGVLGGSQRLVRWHNAVFVRTIFFLGGAMQGRTNTYRATTTCHRYHTSCAVYIGNQQTCTPPLCIYISFTFLPLQSIRLSLCVFFPLPSVLSLSLTHSSLSFFLSFLHLLPLP
jgi:hypothetical protein